MNRKWLAITVGAIGAVLLLRAAAAGYAAYLMSDLLALSPDTSHPSLKEMASLRDSLASSVPVFGGFGILSVASSVGFAKGKRWASIVWLTTATVLVAGVIMFVIRSPEDWSRNAFEGIGAIVSLWLMYAISRKEARDL
jgi:hypothetical protein